MRLRVESKQALAFRFARHNLGRRMPAGSLLEAAGLREAITAEVAAVAAFRGCTAGVAVFT